MKKNKEEFPPLPPEYHFAPGSALYADDVDVFDSRGNLQEWYNARDHSINSAKNQFFSIGVESKEEALALLSARFLLGMN
jgi:hypothetical protein